MRCALSRVFWLDLYRALSAGNRYVLFSILVALFAHTSALHVTASALLLRNAANADVSWEND